MLKKIKDFDLIIFGIKGDLSKKKLIPSLYNLEKNKIITKNSKIIGIGRKKINKKHYINTIYKILKKSLKISFDINLWKKFKKKIYFLYFNIKDKKSISKFKKIINKSKKIICYFATPPNALIPICKTLKKILIKIKNKKIVIEKPIGKNLKSSKKIHHQISKIFKEKHIFRIDHYLGKEMILNLLILRFSNTLFINNWNKNIIDHIQITISEDIGIENRWNYFDKIGQMRDMVQSHILQILAIIAMSTPSKLTENCIHNEKIKVLKSLRPINKYNIKKNTVRGQYTNGLIHGKKVLGYLEEIKSNKTSQTETFVSIKINIDNFQWSGVPFYIRTGKRLKTKYSEIVIYFKKPKKNLFKKYYHILPNNKLIIQLQPNEGIKIEIINKIPNKYYENKIIKKTFNLNILNTTKNIRIPDAYEQILSEIIKNKKILFLRKDEVEESWKWTDLIIKSWKKKNTICLYQAGTLGPIESKNMIQKDGRNWNKYINI